MHIEISEDQYSISQRAKTIILEQITNKPDLLLCAATGSSPTLTYNLMGSEYQNHPGLFSRMRIVKLDEWGGIPLDDQGTCETYVQKKLVEPLKIDRHRYFGFHSNPADPEKECRRVQERLEKEGPIDICILGLGMNGHLALNEPAEYLSPGCHVATLSKTSLSHVMVNDMKAKPAYGLTLGMADIFYSRMILILIQGGQKKEVIKEFLSKKVTSMLPASYLWLHPNVICLVEKNTMDGYVGNCVASSTSF